MSLCLTNAAWSKEQESSNRSLAKKANFAKLQLDPVKTQPCPVRILSLHGARQASWSPRSRCLPRFIECLVYALVADPITTCANRMIFRQSILLFADCPTQNTEHRGQSARAAKQASLLAYAPSPMLSVWLVAVSWDGSKPHQRSSTSYIPLRGTLPHRLPLAAVDSSRVASKASSYRGAVRPAGVRARRGGVLITPQSSGMEAAKRLPAVSARQKFSFCTRPVNYYPGGKLCALSCVRSTGL